MSRPEELETTLLEDRVHAHDLEDGFEEEGEDEDESISHFTGQVRLNHSTSALAATIIGAGIVALPRAFATLGLLLGGVLLTVVFSLSFFSLSALIRAAQAAKCWTYDALARSQFGFLGSGSLDLSIVANNTGSMIIYLIIIGDVLVGAPPHYSGLVTNLFGIHSGDVVWVSRPFVMAIVCVFFLGPLVSLRNLKLLGPMSTAAVVVAGGLVSSIVALAIIAGIHGQLGDFHWLPTREMLGGTPTKILINLLAILPVITMSFVCHYNLLPVAVNLERFTERRISMVIRRALLICTGLFSALASAGVFLFGTSTEANILLNIRPEVVQEYIGEVPSSVLCFSIRLAYCLCLMSTFAMLNWALRETVTKLIFHVRMLEGSGFLYMSYAILFFEYFISILFPNIWVAMSLTGATAAVYVAYILPGALILNVGGDGLKDRVFGAICVVLGVLMGVIGVANTLFLD